MNLPVLILISSITALAFMLAVAMRRKMTSAEPLRDALNISDVIELISRFKFFQGKNLETFSGLLYANDFTGVEQLIREKFEAQGRTEAASLALRVTQMLRS